MGAVTFFDEPVLFGPAIRPETNRRLQMAVRVRARSKMQAERLLWEARAEDPGCLPVYFALYKFYANAKRLEDAERATRLALAEAARQGEFPSDWKKLGSEPKRYDLYASEAGLFYLFSLKALAFIKLRRRQLAEARAILSQLIRLDMEDRSGVSVIKALAESVGLSFQEIPHEHR